ncbi:MAG: GH116 family glycosyl-hydrolase, partial [Myxococcaceae bacterium]
MKKRTTYTGRNLSQISFPLGGIGSGCVGLGGNGRLIDWEIFGRPSKGSTNGHTHFAIKAERDGEVLDARVLHGDEPPPYLGASRQMYFGSGFGVSRDSMAGLPHFRDVKFRGEFPVAELSFREPKFPGKVGLRAFNPFIPLNDADSSLPAGFFEITVANTSDAPLDYTIAFSACNPAGKLSQNVSGKAGGLKLITLQETALAEDDPAKAELTIATDAAETSHQEYWFRGSWFDNLGVYWRDFIKPGPLTNRRYKPEEGRGRDHATLAARVTVAPGETATVRFVLAWHVPNMTNYWNPEKCESGDCQPAVWKHYYATLFANSAATAKYALKHWERLLAETLRFKDALFSSTLPDEVIDAVSANISLLKSPTVLRLTDGSFYGFEGCGCEGGCCEGSCQHVWNYAYALPYLFPKLERSMRELDYRYNMREDGGMAFRLQLPVGRERSGFRPCADGQLGGVIKTYREWKISGDTAWLKSLWPSVKQSLEFAWAPTNADKWDPDQTGVLWGRQHHTLDMELFGPNSWLTGFYLAALKAGAEMAEACGEPEAAEHYLALFARGQEWLEANLFNDEYYQQQVDLEDRSVLELYKTVDPG